MPRAIEFPFPDDAALPNIPITLSYTDRSISTYALLDTGATVNVLPYEMGIQLGAIWEEQTVRLPLAGNLAQVEARGLFVNVQVGSLEAFRLAFAWTKSAQVPLILGQTNFFREFDVCFQRSRHMIEIVRLNKPTGM
jgi:Aspartyl protease